jgi:hypothetical protein
MHELAYEVEDAPILFGIVNEHPLSVCGYEIAHRTRNQVQVLMDQSWGCCRGSLLLNALPEFCEKTKVLLDLTFASSLARRSQNEPSSIGVERLRQLLQTVAFLFVLDAP